MSFPNRNTGGSRTSEGQEPSRQASGSRVPAAPDISTPGSHMPPPSSFDHERAARASPLPPIAHLAPVEPPLPPQGHALPPAGAPRPSPRGYWETVLDPSGVQAAPHGAHGAPRGGPSRQPPPPPPPPPGRAAAGARGIGARLHPSSTRAGDAGTRPSEGGMSSRGAGAGAHSSAASPRVAGAGSRDAGERARDFGGSSRGPGARGYAARGSSPRGSKSAARGAREDQTGSGAGDGDPAGQAPQPSQQAGDRRGGSGLTSPAGPAAASMPRRGNAADRSLHLTCPICGERFSHRDLKNNHIQEKHNENETFKCRFVGCSKIFGHRSSRSRHETAHRWPRGTGPGGRGR